MEGIVTGGRSRSVARLLPEAFTCDDVTDGWWSDPGVRVLLLPIMIHLWDVVCLDVQGSARRRGVEVPEFS